MSVCMYIHVCVCRYACIYGMHMEAHMLGAFVIFLRLIHWVRILQLSPELTIRLVYLANLLWRSFASLLGARITKQDPMSTWVFLWIPEIWTWVFTFAGQVLYPLSPDSSFINSSGGRKIPKEGGRDLHIRPTSYWALDESCAAFLSKASVWVILTAPNHSLIPSTQQKRCSMPQ